MKTVVLTSGLLIALVLTAISQTVVQSTPRYAGSSYMKLIRRVRCYPMYQESKIGLSYAFRAHIPVIKIDDFGVSSLLSSNVEWRLPSRANSYFNSEFIKHDIFNIYAMRNVVATAGFKRVFVDRVHRTEQSYSGIGFFGWRYAVMAAYARQCWQGNEKTVTPNNGILLKLYAEYFDRLHINLSVTYWFNDLQYAVNVREEIHDKILFIGAGWEKTGTWNEFDVSIWCRY
ncbi:MAG: hypothetical protein ACOYXT_15675 [Bacteroidota bacterium]